jgi:type I restriction enzyme, S subunit
VSKANFRPIPIVVPPRSVTDTFAEIAKSLYEQISVNLQGMVILSDLRDLLLPKLLSGEIRVREAERELEAVL